MPRPFPRLAALWFPLDNATEAPHMRRLCEQQVEWASRSLGHDISGSVNLTSHVHKRPQDGRCRSEQQGSAEEALQ